MFVSLLGGNRCSGSLSASSLSRFIFLFLFPFFLFLFIVLFFCLFLFPCLFLLSRNEKESKPKHKMLICKNTLPLTLSLSWEEEKKESKQHKIQKMQGHPGSISRTTGSPKQLRIQQHIYPDRVFSRFLALGRRFAAEMKTHCGNVMVGITQFLAILFLFSQGFGRLLVFSKFSFSLVFLKVLAVFWFLIASDIEAAFTCTWHEGRQPWKSYVAHRQRTLRQIP